VCPARSTSRPRAPGGNQHPKLVLQQWNQRIEHRAIDHQPMQQQQRFAVADDLEKHAI
jgi:hypothetical protein